MTLAQFESLKAWHQRHWREQPLEKHVWDLVLTLWLAGWVGTPVTLLVHAGWALAVCGALFFLPSSYVAVRRRLHDADLLRCDWIAALATRSRRS